MLNIYSLVNNFNGFFSGFLLLISAISLLSAVLIIITKNPIVSVLYLILLFSSIACYLIFIGLSFIGLSYLLVYVGAVSILFLFILMLINIRVSELISDTSNNIPLAILTTLALFIPLSNVLPDNKFYINQTSVSTYDTLFKSEKQVSYVSSNNWDGSLVDVSDIMSIGNVMYTSYSIWLLITSIILLLAMVGSIIITLKQKH